MSSADLGDADLLYSRTDHKRVKKLFGVQLGFLSLMGQMPLQLDKRLPASLKGLGLFLTRFYCSFMIGLSLHLTLLYIKTTYDAWESGELDLLTDGITMVLIYSFSCYGTCYWMWRSQQLSEFLERIDKNYRHHSLLGLTYVSAYRAYSTARKITMCWLGSCMSGVTFWGVAPLILRTHTLPLSCWYPFDPLQPGVYEVTYTLQLLGQLNMGVTFGNGSALFVSLVLIMLGQLDVLFCSLKNLNFNARLLAGGDLRELRLIQDGLPLGQDDELNQYLFAEENKTSFEAIQLVRDNQRKPFKPLKQTLHAALVECVRMHRFILHSCDTLEALFNPYCLVKSLQITLQLCLLVFVGVVGERSSVRIINLIQYLGLTLIELLMFTYCGELLSNHSLRVGEAFWRSQWWTNAHVVRKDTLIFLANSRRVVKLTAGKFYPMDVERLRSVVTQAFSFFTLLQKLAAKNEK